jgi:hypothetical protein
MYAQLDTGIAAARYTQVFDAITQFIGISDIGLRNMTDALGLDGIEL